MAKLNAERSPSANIPDFKSPTPKGEKLNSSDLPSGGSIFGLILLLIILFNIPSFVAGNGDVSSYFSFERFMNMLTSAPTVDMTWITNTLQPITANWGGFQFFADFLNSIITLLQGISFIAVGIVNLVSYLLYFLKFLFNL